MAIMSSTAAHIDGSPAPAAGSRVLTKIVN
jgi:hypothetical protein